MKLGYIFVVLVAYVGARPTEEERVKLWHQDVRNTWPPTWQSSETPEFKTAMQFREEELLRLPGMDERWENYMQFTQSRMVPRFTTHGFEVIQTPSAVHEKLKTAVDKGIENWDKLRHERQIDAVHTPLPSKFVDLHGLDWKVLKELKSLHEQWSGLELEPTSAYGVRLYQNGSSLVMHYDKIFTHVISSIVHIAHEYDDNDEPWPIEIEDHNGKLHSVNLEPGQMLFYESAACLHGRRRIFHGKYYGSIFLHYQPADKNIWNFSLEDIIARVPPHWSEGVLEDKGNRWAGQGLTIDSRATDSSPPRVVRGQVVEDIKQYYADVVNQNHASADEQVDNVNSVNNDEL